MPESISSCGRVECAASENDLARRQSLALLARIGARICVSLIEPDALEVFDADGALVCVEEDTGGQRVEFDRQIPGIFLLCLDEPLARADAAMVARRERGIMNAERVLADEPPVVRIALPGDEPFQPLAQRRRVRDRAGERHLERRLQFEIAKHGLGDGDFGVEPAIKTVAGRIDPKIFAASARSIGLYRQFSSFSKYVRILSARQEASPVKVAR